MYVKFIHHNIFIGAIQIRYKESLVDKAGEIDKDKWKFCWKECRDQVNQYGRDKKKAVKKQSKKIQIYMTASNLETAIQSSNKENALGCLSELKALLNIKTKP